MNCSSHIIEMPFHRDEELMQEFFSSRYQHALFGEEVGDVPLEAAVDVCDKSLPESGIQKLHIILIDRGLLHVFFDLR